MFANERNLCNEKKWYAAINNAEFYVEKNLPLLITKTQILLHVFKFLPQLLLLKMSVN